MVVGEILTGLALVRQGVSFVKDNINTAKDINEIMGAVDSILDGENQINKTRSGKAGVGGIKDQLGIKSVSTEIINAKLAAEERYQMSLLIDHRFGNGTWKQIVDLRAKRIQEAKEEAARLKKIQEQKQQEMLEIAMAILAVIVAAGLLMGGLLFLMN